MSAARAILLAALLGACSGPQQPLRVEDAWVRALPPGATTTAAYMTIENRSGRARRLIAVTSPQFARAELHETSFDHGMARMRPVDELALPAGAKVALTPGGLHLMLFDPSHPIDPHERIRLRLQLDDGWVYEVDAEVRAP